MSLIAPTLQSFFTDRLVRQRRACRRSPKVALSDHRISRLMISESRVAEAVAPLRQ
jgi:hypothetical protein